MVAGATGIDLFLLVVDAGEGARPQTHEHLAILRLLGVGGVVAVTKVDAVDDETRELALLEARELVPDAAVVATSARRAKGSTSSERRSGRPPSASTNARRRCRPDSGSTGSSRCRGRHGGHGDALVRLRRRGRPLRAEPAGLDVRVRASRCTIEPVERAEAGQRVAVALPGVERSDLRRGDALVERGAYPPSYRLDVALEPLERSPRRARARPPRNGRDHGPRRPRSTSTTRSSGSPHPWWPLEATTSSSGSGRRSAAAWCSTRLPLAHVRRAPRPPGTRRPGLDRARCALGRGRAAAPRRAGQSSAACLRRARRRARNGHPGGRLVPTEEQLEELGDDVVRALDERAASSSLDPGIAVAELLPQRPWANALLPLLPIERRGAKAYAQERPRASATGREAADRLEGALEEAGFTPVKVEDADLARFLEEAGRLVRLGDGLAVGGAAYEEARRLLVEECEAAGSITLARFRDLLGTGRKPAQLLLERFDADGVTRRVGDERVLRRKARTG